MATLVPVVALVKESDLATLNDFITSAAEAVEEQRQANPALARTFLLSGWSDEMIAWGQVIGALAQAVRDDTIELQRAPAAEPAGG